MLELSDKEVKITMVNILRGLMEQVDHMKDQMGNVSGKMDIIKQTNKKFKGNTRNKKHSNRHEEGLGWLIGGFDTARGRKSGKLKMSQKNSQT